MTNTKTAWELMGIQVNICMSLCHLGIKQHYLNLL